MEKQIKEVNDYFVNKLLEEDFEIIEVREYTVEIKIDNKYHFNLWIANGFEYFEVDSNRRSFMNLEFDDTQKEKIYNDLIKKSKNQKLEYLLKQKERIESELKNL